MKWLMTCLLCILMGVSSCKEESILHPSAKINSYKIAVIAPLSQPQWKYTAEWALENIRKSQSALSEQVDLNLVWIDESDKYINNRMKSVLSDSAVVAVVGPISSSKARKLASFDVHQKKPLILPCATATDLHRMYANCGYLWHLSNNDIEQIEILLMQVMTYGARKAHLLARDDEYGETFLSWISFVAEQFGVEIGEVESFETIEEEVDKFQEIISQKQIYSDYLIYVPSSYDDIIALDKYISTLSEYQKSRLPNIISTDVFTSLGVELDIQYDKFEGVDLTATAESGFALAYKHHFGTEMTNGLAQFYDSFQLLALSLTRMEAVGGSLNASIHDVTAGDEEHKMSWLPADMTEVYRMEREGRCPDIEGVSSDLSFKDGRNSVRNSTYRHWRLVEHQTKTVEYLSTYSTTHSLGSVDILEWDDRLDQDFYWDSDRILNYPSLCDHWALLVAGSRGWSNYRHQADVYAMYQLLRRHGYSSDHIIVIAEDDIAFNPKNLYPGEVRIAPGGDNVYSNLSFDYQLSRLKPSDLRNILCGVASNSTEKVLSSGSLDDVFVYWCGHGDRNALEFGNYVITGEQMASILQDMSNKGRFRKLLFALEACYGGSIGMCLDGIPGLLCVSAANDRETSKADVQDLEMGVWMSNGFTRGFQNAVDKDSNISLRDLYFELVSSTWGSHVSVYNENYFGSMYENRMSEFLPE